MNKHNRLSRMWCEDAEVRKMPELEVFVGFRGRRRWRNRRDLVKARSRTTSVKLRVGGGSNRSWVARIVMNQEERDSCGSETGGRLGN